MEVSAEKKFAIGKRLNRRDLLKEDFREFVTGGRTALGFRDCYCCYSFADL